MHKKRTRFARRVTRMATKAESRGIRATYALHDRVLGNRSARRRQARSAPTLDATQQRLLDAVRREGFAVCTFAELFGETPLWDEVSAAADAFIAETADGLAREAAGESVELRRSVKSFLVRKNAWGATLDLDDVWLRLALESRVLDLANAYLGLWSKLEYVDLWYTPRADDPEWQSSQRWHRDFNDRLLLKAFLYLNDVDESAGPFQYVPESFPGGRLGDLWPWYPGYDGYPPDEQIAERLAGERVETFTGTRGTMVLCNTAGFHRGGHATGKERVLATWTYASPAALKALSERNFVPLSDAAAAELGPAQRHAVS